MCIDSAFDVYVAVVLFQALLGFRRGQKRGVDRTLVLAHQHSFCCVPDVYNIRPSRIRSSDGRDSCLILVEVGVAAELVGLNAEIWGCHNRIP